MKFVIATIIFALDVWAIASIINSDESNGTKLIWILLVALLPVVGLIIWWFAGPKANYSS
ncbi:PLD nuclease N-terminal domain-containing protein [Paracoccus sp. (in: a-proteobacteria)]|uniref:PLD nuclease N-terminal domain-containing protein n=1 Tax=Paracoccus sp. TaxID=267 RepID=UPI0035AE579A